MNLRNLLKSPKTIEVIPYTRKLDKREHIGALLIWASLGLFVASLGFGIEMLILPMPVISLLGLWLLSPQWGALMWSLEMGHRRCLEIVYFSGIVQSLIIFLLITLKLIGK